MRVKMIADETVRVDNLNSKTYPKGWGGDVADSLANTWIDRGTAEELPAEETPTELTEAEKRLLKAAAQQALKAGSVGAPEPDVDTDDADNEDEGETQSPQEILASMTDAEIAALAKQHGIEPGKKKRATLEAAILKAIGAEA